MLIFSSFSRKCVRLLYGGVSVTPKLSPGVLLNVCARKRFFSCDTTTKFTEQKVNVNGVDINYVRGGDGIHTVLLMPGALGSAWTDFTPQLKGLDPQHFTIIAWDPPGYGKSIPPYREFPIDFLERDADTALLLMKSLNIKKFSPLGWSDGGISAMFLASKYPQYMHKMVIWGANSYILNTELAAYQKIRDTSIWSARMREPLEKLYGPSYLAETWGKWCDAMATIYQERRGDICKGHLANIKCDTMVLYGGKDALVHDEHYSILTTNFTNSVGHIYPEGGHNIHLKYSDDFNKRVTEFLLK